MNKDKKVMIVGAGLGQVPLVKICLKRGYKIIVVSIDGDYPCFELTDNIRYADITDKESVLKIAKEEKIDAVISDQCDMAVTTVAYVSEMLGLPSISYDTALKFTNKYEMRKAAMEIGISVPQFMKVNNVIDALEFARKVSFPLIIKPVDGWSSRGVHRVDNIAELENNFNDSLQNSISGNVIIEQFINGKEYLADGFAMDYKYYNLDVGEKEYFDVPGKYISKMCMFTSVEGDLDEAQQAVLQVNKKLIEGLGLQFGITHAEYLYNASEKKVYLVEVAARGGGIYLSSDITPTATGFSTNEALVDFAVEQIKITPDDFILDKKTSCWVCFALPAGIVTSVSGVNELKDIPGVFQIHLEKIKVGMCTRDLKNDDGKYGPVLIVGDNPEDCRKAIAKVKDTLEIVVDTKDGKKGIIW